MGLKLQCHILIIHENAGLWVGTGICDVSPIFNEWITSVLAADTNTDLICSDSASEPHSPAADEPKYTTHFLCLCPCLSRWWGERGLSVTCPHSELRPLPFLCGSPVPVLLTGKSLCSTLCPSQFSPVDLYFQCKSYLLVIGLWAFAYASLLVHCCHPDGVQTLTAALCFQIATHTHTHLRPLLTKALNTLSHQ